MNSIAIYPLSVSCRMQKELNLIQPSMQSRIDDRNSFYRKPFVAIVNNKAGQTAVYDNFLKPLDSF